MTNPLREEAKRLLAPCNQGIVTTEHATNIIVQMVEKAVAAELERIYCQLNRATCSDVECGHSECDTVRMNADAIRKPDKPPAEPPRIDPDGTITWKQVWVEPLRCPRPDCKLPREEE